MIEVAVKPQWLNLAMEKAKELGVLRHSFMKGDGNVAGFLGEIIVADYIGAEIDNTFHWDLVKNGLKIDVKTKRCGFEPLPHYECSIAGYNTRQECDVYAFVRILKSFQTAWLCGYIRKENYFKLATFYKKGYLDTSNNMEFKEDSYNLPISELTPFKTKS